MSLHSIINSRLGIGFVLAIGKIIAPKTGYRLADAIVNIIMRNPDSRLVRSVRANQWVVTGKKLSAEELDLQTRETLRQNAHCIFDLYHNLYNYQAILDRVTLSPKLIEILQTRTAKGEGTLMIAPHLSNFDFAGRAMALHGYKVQVLSYPQPRGSYRWQNRLRRDIGIDITPMSTESMRAAKAHLRSGGLVITGLERPLEKTNYFPRFFGFPAPVPTSYVRMAMQTDAAVLMVACVGTPEEDYKLECSDPIYMKSYDNATDEIEKNAEAVLGQAEPFIRDNPTQWAMTYPVWPSALDEMP
jgi:lauroyl/myristoyl acyltransferase